MANKTIEFEQLKDEPDSMFTLAVYCGDGCGELLNRTIPMSGADLVKRWTMLTLSQSLVTKSCPNGCRATFSDCNMNVATRIERHAE